MAAEVSCALAQSDPNLVLSAAFKLRITQRDLATLQEGGWLNDEVCTWRDKTVCVTLLDVYFLFWSPSIIHNKLWGCSTWYTAGGARHSLYNGKVPHL